MALPPDSAVASACRAVGDHVTAVFRQAGNNVKILIGTPVEVAAATTSEHRLNLFFYRFEPTASEAGVTSGETLRLRVHCVFTAFGIQEENVSAGENDLRIIGEVIRLFHEQPVLDPVIVGGETFVAQVVFEPLSLDDINRLWATQKDATYRPSVAYEIALMPVPPRVAAVAGPLVGAIGLDVTVPGAPPHRAPTPPALDVIKVDTSREDWAPALCLVRGGACQTSVSLPATSAELTAPLAALIAGQVGASVELRWDVWHRDTGWASGGLPKEALVGVATIDPRVAVPPGAATSVSAPPLGGAGQAVLYAVRAYPRASDGHRVEVHSNAVLLTVTG